MSSDVLLARSGSRLCAMNVGHVEEIMRPLPLETLPGAPIFVRGVSVVRGKPTPIVDLRTLLGDGDQGAPARLVTLRITDTRRVGLLVDEVAGVVDGRALAADDLPPLLQDAAPELVDRLAQLDDRLLTLLRAGNLVPEDLWSRLSGEETAL